MDEGENDVPVGEQFAFSQAHDLVRRLIEDKGFPAVDVGRGVFIAALATLRKVMSEPDIAKILYEAADDYATRHLEK